ncbi:MAG: Ig-like domain-containing protein [Caldilineaceae bacterium]
MNQWRRVFSIFLILSIMLQPGALLAAPGAQPTATPIRLKAGILTPGEADNVVAASGLTINGYAAGQRGYYIVQFHGPVQQSWKEQVSATGAQLLGYLPDYAFKVRMTPEQAAQVGKLADVNWVGLFQPAYKLAPQMSAASATPQLVRVQIEQGGDVAATTAAVVQTGAQLLQQEDDLLLVAANGAQLAGIAQVLDVAWLEAFRFNEKHNEYGAGVILGANVANATGYDGSTQIAAVADTGFGTGVAATAHVDVPASRIVALQNFAGANSTGCYNVINDGVQDVDSGHGTHVALSVLGDGGANGEGKGTAPAARLVFQAVENYTDFVSICALSYADGYYLIGIPANIGTLFQSAYDAGARIHSNSWGSAAAGDYTTDSVNADSFIWSHKDMLVTFSAGNEGTDANANGVVDNDSIGSPATAKNVLTVGASENDRGGNYNCDTSLTYTSHDAYQPGQSCSSMGGQNLLGTYGQRWGTDFPAAPLAADLTAGNKEQMAGFSSRGPTDDGRIKPDVVAPGTWVLSGYSDMYQEGYDAGVNPTNGAYQLDGWGMPINRYYKYFGGTSMSNPLAAGAATVVRDYYQKAKGIAASAALVKATLINTAVDMLDENNDGANDNDFPIPNVHEGWGRINLIAATSSAQQYVDNATGLGTGGNAAYQFAIGTAGSPFKVSLVWSDYPSTAAAAANLVNDLDLVVTSPTGTVYHGNVFSGGWSQTGGSADRVNNVENVYVQSAATGTWTVQVSGFNVPQGPQAFALVVNGAFGTVVDNPPTVSLTAPANGATVAGTQNVTASAGDDFGVTQVEFFVDGVSIGVDTSAPYGVNWNTTTASNGGHTISATARDTANQTTSTSINVTVNNVVVDNPPTVSITAPANGATVAGSQNVTASASDDHGVTQVEFFVDGASIGVDTSAPYGVSWNTTTASNGGHTISATAKDTANQTSSTSVNVTVNNAAAGNVLYVSSTTNGNVGFAFNDEDILRFDPSTNSWSLFFDGSDVGMTTSGADINAFDILDDGTLLINVLGTSTLPTVGSVTNADIVHFTPTSLGSTTAGTFSWYFDGSDVGLTTSGEAIDTIDQLPDGRILISTSGSASVTGASAADEDILAFTPTALGATTSGTWALYFDGSDVGLSNTASEDVGGVWVDSSNGDIYLSTIGTFSVAGVSGDGSDIFVCHPSSLGANTACTFGPGLYFDGSTTAFAGQVLDAVALSPASFGGTFSQNVNDANENDAPSGDDSNPANPDDVEMNNFLFLPLVVGE